MLLAQCIDPTNCDIPHTVPWWMVTAFVAVWLALVVGIVSLVTHLVRSRTDRRRTRRRPAERTDVELYRGDPEPY